jgi:predicted MFS family arabinose efflux permease
VAFATDQKNKGDKLMSNKGFWRYENGLVAMLGVTFGLVFYDRLAITFLFPFIAPELQLSNTQLGMISSALALAWAISGYLLGAYADRRGNRKAVLIVAVAGFSVCTALSGAAASFALLLLVRAVMGFCEGPVLPIVQSIMAEESTPSRRGFNMGFLQNAAGSILALIIGPPLTAVLAETLGWRHSLYAVAVPGLVMAFLLFLFLRGKTSQQEAVSTQATPVEHLNFAALMAYRNVWLGVLVACCLVSWMLVLFTFAPIYLVHTRGLSPQEMGVVMSMLGVGSLIWGFVVPMLSDRLGRKPVVIVFSLLSALCPLVLALLPASLPVLALLVLATFLAPGCFPLVMATIPSETVPAKYVATALGLIMGIGEIVGGVLAPTFAGVGSDAFGPEFPLFVSAGGALLAGCLSLFLVETAPARVRLGMPLQVSEARC